MSDLTPTARDTRAIVRWLVAVCALIVAMVAVGGITRLTESGLSIVEWRPITGAVPPVTDDAWNEAFERYRQFPHFREHFRGTLSLHDFKRIFFWEWFHRLLGRLIGLAYGLPLAWFWLRGRLTPSLKRELLIGLCLGGAQGAMGWFMVKSGLVDLPRVSHYRLCAHLLMAFGTMAWLEWISLDLTNPDRDPHTSSARPLRSATRVFTALLVAQIAWGAFTAGLRAGYGYPTWPTMNGAWAPTPFWVSSPAWLSVLESPPTVHFVHRWLGAAVGSLAVLLAVFGPRLTDDPRAKAALRVVGAVATLQFVLGVVTVLTSVHLHVAVTHQVVGCLLLAAAVNLLHTQRAR